MPCTAKKFEAQREEFIENGLQDIDAVITTRELIRLIKLFGIDFNKLEPESSDNPFRIRSSAGKIFGTSGGVMEAAIRTAYNLITGKELDKLDIRPVRGINNFKEAKLNIEGLELNVAVVLNVFI